MGSSPPTALRGVIGLSVEAARECMRAGVEPLPRESVSLSAVHGRTLAAPVLASRSQPPFRSSAMDGYALRAADLGLGSLTVIGESSAGKAHSGTLDRGEAVRIFTGAPVPEGADLVVPQERTRRDGDAVFIDAAWTPAANIRMVAADFRAGAILLPAGTRLSSRDIALIAAAGIARVEVSRRPRIALLATGTEIRTPGEPAGPFEIYDSVTFGLGAMIDDWGGHPERLGTSPDDDTAVAATVRRAVEEADLVVIAGGASVGDYDVVKRALKDHGLEVSVPQVAIRPGKPTWFGTLRAKPVLGLPGNPAAAFVCAQLFLRPLLDAMLGRPAPRQYAAAVLDGVLGPNGGSESFLRAAARMGPDARLTVRAFADQDTSLVSVFAAANALIRRPSGAPAAAAGTMVEIFEL